MPRRAAPMFLLTLACLVGVVPAWTWAAARAQSATATPSSGGLLLGPTPTPTSAATPIAVPTFGGLVLGPTPTPPGNAYTSPTYGYSLTWDPSWHMRTETSANGVDQLTLTNGASNVVLTAAVAFAGQPAPCLQEMVSRLKSDTSYRGVQAGPGANGKPLAGSDATRSWAVYLADHVVSGESPRPVAEYLECRTLVAHAAVLMIDDEVAQSAFNAQAPALQALLARIVLRAALASPTASVGTPIMPPPVASPTSATSAACSGVAAWVAATRPRIEQTITIANELAASLAGGGAPDPTKLAGYAAQFTQLEIAQRSQPVPPAAAAINDLLVSVFTRYSSGLTSLAIDLPAGDQAGTAQAVTLLQQADADFRTAVTEGTQLATRCGITS
jgi:hypothetical protein